MKFFATFLLTALLSFISGLFLPWWGIAIAAFIVSLLVHQKAGKAFAAAFAAVFFLWMGLAWLINSKNENILSSRIGELFGIGNNLFLLILISATIGALIAGFAAMSASFLRSKKV
ncbi:MAG: hypothetical protein ACSLE0_22845 [Chitinophagaceae bacterium]